MEYWRRESWVSYLRNDVLPLYESSLSILNLWMMLKRFDGKLLSDLIKDFPKIEFIFVAGTSPPDKYEADGLAYIYKELLGTSIKLREYYFLKSHGKEPRTTCKVEKTYIVEYIGRVSPLLERVLNRAYELGLLATSEIQNAQENSWKRAEEVLDEPEKMPELFADFLNKALNFTATYNEHTKLLWHLRKITKAYLKKLYPKILEPDVFKFFQDLGLREYIVPNVEDPEIADLYTIFSFDYALKFQGLHDTRSYKYLYIDGITYVIYPKFRTYPTDNEPCKTIGGCLCRVNELIWNLTYHDSFRSHLTLIVDNLPDPVEEWKNLFKGVRYLSGDCNFIGPLNSYEGLSRLEEYLPAIFVGAAELVKGERGVYVCEKRW